MVSKITKKPRRPRVPPPEKLVPAAAASAIRHSLRSCRRKLLRIFAHLAILPPSTPKTLIFSRLKPLYPDENDRKTIVFDLDETLVHSKTDPATENYDFIIYPSIDGQIIPFYVLKRPGCDELLKMASQSFEVIVFTAGLREYASLVLDLLDPKGVVISHRLYRDSCREIGGKFVKDLSGLGRDLGRVVIVDDNPSSYSLQPENAVPVKPFVSDLGDGELERVMEFLEVAEEFDDMREAVKCFLLDERRNSWVCI